MLDGSELEDEEALEEAEAEAAGEEEDEEAVELPALEEEEE